MAADPPALAILRREHAALAAVLRSLQMLLAQYRCLRATPDFELLRAMLFYLDEFPHRRHHRQESEVLFPKLRARTPRSRDLLDRLDEEHARGEHRIRDLEYALLAFEMLGESRRDAFEQAVDRYTDFYLAHMALEDQQILPLAQGALTAQDWADVEAAFRRNGDALAGQAAEAPYQALFTRIANRAPAPIGLGEPLQAAPAG